MTEKALKATFNHMSPFLNLNFEFLSKITFSRSLSTTSHLNTILTLKQLNKEAQKLSLYFKILSLEGTYENYKKYIIQKEALTFLEKIHSKILQCQELKKLKADSKEIE